MKNRRILTVMIYSLLTFYNNQVNGAVGQNENATNGIESKTAIAEYTKPVLLEDFPELTGNGQEISVYGLTVEHKTKPLGVDETHPRFSWKLKSNRQNVLQTHYRIQVSTDPAFTEFVWKSGKVASSQSVLLEYRGKQLAAQTRYYWRVKVWDNKEGESAWSQTEYWETGMMSAENWQARWIEPVQVEQHSGPAAMVRKNFSIHGKIKQARAYVSAHGIYELHINGEKIGDQVFTPGWTSYEERVQYQVFDITDALKSGSNAVGAYIGDGWYRGQLAWGKDNWAHYGRRVGLICQLLIEYQDGREQTIISDESWKGTMEGPVTMNSIYNGESYDARKEMDGWDKPGFSDKDWKRVLVSQAGTEKLIAMETVPVRKIEEIKPVRIFKTPKGTLVADMGQNMVGWVRLKVKGKEGTRITIRHAEVLDKYGEFYTENLRAAKATLQYTLKGKGIETYEPRFTFMGFRYLAIDGYPGALTTDKLTGVVIHSDMEPTGTFACSDSLINQLQHNILWGQKGNFLDVPTDCPQRDERLGWTGDAQVFVRTAAFNMNVAPFFIKWLKDVAIAQNDEGVVPFVVPYVMDDFRPSAGWSDVITVAPWTIYTVYGDKQLLETMYPAMKKYVEYVRKEAGEDYIWEGGSVFGDWLFFKPELNFWTVPDGHTDQNLIATAFFAYSTSLLQKSAAVLGKKEDVEEYQALLKNIKKAFNAVYVTPAGMVLSDSQTSYVLALMFDLLEENQKEAAVNRLVRNIRNRGNHLSTGFLGTPYLCHVLSENGKTEVAYDLLLQKTYPSWIYPITMGATTIWERWDGQKPDSTFQNADMNSFNHYAYGAIGDWMYRVVAGIDLGAPGYQKIIIAPQPDKRLRYAKGSLESSYGLIESGWSIEGSQLTMKVSIPVNTQAKVNLPFTNADLVTINGEHLTSQISQILETKSGLLFELGSGEYEFKMPYSH